MAPIAALGGHVQHVVWKRFVTAEPILDFFAEAAAHFGFVAQEIADMKIGPAGSPLSLNSGGGNDNDPLILRYNVAGSRDVRVFEFV